MVDKEIFDLAKIANIGGPNLPTLGNYVCIIPTAPPGVEENDNKGIELNYTAKPGEAAAIYYGLFFQLPKWGWTVVKADEWIEVSPTHKEYYDRTIATKQMLESTIKTGLTSAAQAVADYELMNHDLRRYRQIMNDFNNKDEHLLKAMFVDQVDVHTDMPGQPISMRSIAPRWPTIIADFMKLSDDDDETGKVQKKFDISRAEAVILVTKNKLYKHWKKTFLDVSKERYEMLRGQVEARRKTINEYKEWLKPYIARFKMTKLGGERVGVRKPTLEAFADITGIATFANNIRLFTWKVLRTAEPRRPAQEVKKDFAVYPYDDFVRNVLILGNKDSLANIYPWLRNEKKYCSKCGKYFPSGIVECPKCGSINLEDKTLADQIVEERILPAWKRRERNLDPYEMYYLFLDYDVMRVGTRLPSGELEDITFTIKTCVMSQNVLLLKLIELECRSMELEWYIDEMLGMSLEEKSIKEIVMDEFPEIYPKKKLSGSKEYVKELKESFEVYTNFLNKIKLPKFGNLRFFKPGSYEKDFRERISKNYSTVAGANFIGIVEFLKTRMRVM
jgi:ribosomal protein L40E